MGLFSLISRKFGHGKKKQVHAPPYEPKPSARSPVRIVRAVATPVESVPAPVVRDSRDDPSARATADRPVSRRPGTSSGLSIKGPLSLNRPLLRPRTFSQTLHDVVSRPSFTWNQASSVKTDGGMRSHVDVLDAHSELTAADFHGRVQASGAREFGEDVADRNIAINGLDLDSDLVRKKLRPLSASAAMTLRHTDHELVMKQASLDSVLWARQHSSPVMPMTSRSAKRQTLSILPSFEPTLEHAVQKTRPRSFHQGIAGLQPAVEDATHTDRRYLILSPEDENEDLRFCVNDEPLLSSQLVSPRLSASMVYVPYIPKRGSSARHSLRFVSGVTSDSQFLRERTNSFLKEEDNDANCAPSPSIKLNQPVSPMRVDFRPESHNTASTEQGSMQMPSMVNPSLSSVSTGNDDRMLEALADDMGGPKDATPRATRAQVLNGDYISDDDEDSFIASQRDDGKSEEDLLFHGYGANGQQLPGLCGESFDIPAPEPELSPRSQRHSFFRSLDNPKMRRSAPVGFKDNFDEASTNDVLRYLTSLGKEGTVAEEAEEAAREEKRPSMAISQVDVASAVRVRKEAKSWRRASLVSIHSRRGRRLAGENGAGVQERIDEV